MLKLLFEALGLGEKGFEVKTEDGPTFEVLEIEGDEITVQEHFTGDDRKFVITAWELHDS